MPRGQSGSGSRPGFQFNNPDNDPETIAMKNEYEALLMKMNQMNKILTEKDQKIEQQRAEITNLRRKNFDFRSKMV